MNSSKETLINIEEPQTSNEPKKAAVNILCLDITAYSPLAQFSCCCIFVFICYLAYGYFLELIYSKEGHKSLTLYITLVQFIFTFLLSYLESLMREKITRTVPLRTYALLAALTLGTMCFSNLALSYLNYPTQLIFKSCKLIPVMVGSIIIMQKKYGFLDYLAAIIMCIGLTMFTLADSSTSPNFDFVGVIVISMALLCDAVIGNVQEKAMKKYQASNNEVVFYSYAIASMYLFVFTAFSGILTNGYTTLAEQPITIYVNIFLLSLSGYLGLQAVLTLVRICGATVAVTVTTMRKAVSIIISFLIFSKPFVFQHMGLVNLCLRVMGAVAVLLTSLRFKALSGTATVIDRYVWSGMLVALAIYLNHCSKKRPNYVPAPVRRCWQLITSFYQSEYRYLQIKTKLYSDTV